MVCVTEFDSPTNILLTSTPLIFSTLKNYPNKFGVPLNVQKHTFQIENENHNFKYHINKELTSKDDSLAEIYIKSICIT